MIHGGDNIEKFIGKGMEKDKPINMRDMVMMNRMSMMEGSMDMMQMMIRQIMNHQSESEKSSSHTYDK